MEIGRKIYFEKSTGNVILDTGERTGSVVETSVEQDIASYSVLADRVRDSFDVILLDYGQHRQDFNEATAYRVNVDTNELEFSYPDPSEPDVPLVFEKPLTEQLAELEQENHLLKAQIQVNSDRTDFHEDLIAEIAMMVYQ